MADQIKNVIASIPPSVTVVAVTKTFPFERVQEAYTQEARHFGENRVHEAEEKIILAHQNNMRDIAWHMIGHVQGNKARDVAKLFDCVDSVDSIDLAKQLDKEAASAGKKLRILLEVNLSGELTKYGFDLAHWDGQTDKRDRFLATISDLTRFSNITIEGLMTMPRYVTNPEDNRAIFQSMKKLSETLRTQTPGFGSELSMGTSCDYRVAIEEGATQVRLGEVLFGKRPVVR